MNLLAIQEEIRNEKLDGWLFFDHHVRDPLAYRVLGFQAPRIPTRRWYYFIPAQGEPHKLVHRIESGRLDSLPGSRAVYSSWQELHSGLAFMLAGAHRLAMQYSPDNDILYVSMVDAGTVEFLRSLGKQVVTSADLVARFEAVLTAEQAASHFVAQQAIDSIVAEAWHEVARRLRPSSGRPAGITEYELMLWLGEAMRREGLTFDSGPDVSVNANTSDSHYEPTAERSSPIREDDFLLIDIWGRVDRPGTVFYDITWTAVVGREPSARELAVFATVTRARDAAISAVEQAFAAGRPIRGFEADDAARGVIRAAGLAHYFTHRTGHNIGRELHGAGAHLDNLETHDVRRILPNTCFSVEPGIYLPEFGVRSEVNMLTAPGKAWVTGRIQQELVRI